MFVKFARQNVEGLSVDGWERLGNLCVGLLPLSCTKVVTVRKNEEGAVCFDEANTAHKIVAIACAILVFPVAFVGLLSFQISKSHRTVSRLHASYQYIQAQEVDEIVRRQIFDSRDYSPPELLPFPEHFSIEESPQEESSFVMLPNEMLFAIFSHLDFYSLYFTSKTSQLFQGYIAKYCSKRIKKTVQEAELFNGQITDLTGGRFSCVRTLDTPAAPFQGSWKEIMFLFDLHKWKGIGSDLSEMEWRFNAVRLTYQCRFDLLESLAEYNVDQGLFEERVEGAEVRFTGSHFIEQLQLPQGSKGEASILSFAKQCLKVHFGGWLVGRLSNSYTLRHAERAFSSYCFPMSFYLNGGLEDSFFSTEDLRISNDSRYSSFNNKEIFVRANLSGKDIIEAYEDKRLLLKGRGPGAILLRCLDGDPEELITRVLYDRNYFSFSDAEEANTNRFFQDWRKSNPRVDFWIRKTIHRYGFREIPFEDLNYLLFNNDLVDS